MPRRPPVVMQLNAVECGAACLAMILRSHGRNARLAECSERCGTGRDGVTALAIKRAAESYGLATRAFAAGVEQLEEVVLPAVLQWEGSHFVVLERCDPRGALIIDPAVGRRRLSAAELGAGYQGLVLTFEPGPDFDPTVLAGGLSWKGYLKTLLSERPVVAAIASIALLSLLVQALGLVLPLATKVVVDRVIPEGSLQLLPILALGAVVCAGFYAVMTFLRALLLLYVQVRVDAAVMVRFFTHLLTLPYRYFQTRTTGDLMLRLGSNVMLRDLLTNQSVAVIFDAVLVVGYLGILLAWSPPLAAVALAFAVVQVGLLLGSTRTISNLMQRDLQAQAAAESTLVETLVGIATLKAGGSEGLALAHWIRLFVEQLRISVLRGRVSALVAAAMTACQLLAPLVILLAGAGLVLGGALSLGTMLALAAVASSFLAPVASLVSTGLSLQIAGAYFERIADVLDAEPEQQGGGRRPVGLRGRLALENVSFRYDPDSPLVLEDVTFVVEPGQELAIVGATGSGKSTILKLVLGLYLPTGGRVLWDGTPLQEWDLHALRQGFGVVMQEPALFSRTIAENIGFGHAGLSREEIERAADLAAIGDEIAALPMGYDTVLAEAGGGISGGQRQRLALARALAHSPTVLLLDEATSQLDAVTASRIDSNLGTLPCTRLVIAHRPSTVRGADHIVVLDAGRVVEQGTDSELLAKGGAYAALLQAPEGG